MNIPVTIIFEPLIPEWSFALAMLLGAVVVAISIIRYWRSGLLRALAVAALIALVGNPQLRETERTPLDDIAIIVVDESASQQLDGRNAVTEAAMNGLEERLGNLENIETRIVAAEGDEETRLIETLRTALSDAPRARLSGVFIISDGQTTDGNLGDDLALAAPVHFLSTGSDAETDRKITLVNAPRYGLVRDKARISFRVDDLGSGGAVLEEGGAALVTLRIDGKDMFSQPVPIGVEASFDAPLDRPGRTVIELEVEERRGELTTRNNIAVLPITAIRDRLRVLLISGEPHPGERVWRNLLKSDAAVDLVHFTILRPIEKNDGTPISELALIPFPQDELFIDKLSEFDLLIFDRYTYRGVLSSYHFDNIARYVDEGGAVLIASGPEYNGVLSLASRRNLSFILPALPVGAAVEGAFRPAVTDKGARHPVSADLPEADYWGRWLRIMPVTQLRGQTLMAGPQASPLLILDRIGDGRVGLFLSDHFWLWARGFDGGGPHAELLRRIAHWLMKEPELEEEALMLHGDGGTLFIKRRTMSEEAPQVVVTAPSGEERELLLTQSSPGLFEGRIDNAERGLHRAASGDLFAIGAVGLAAAPEFQNVISTAEHLAPLTQATGGGVFNIRTRGLTARPEANLPAIRSIRENAGSRAGPGWAGVLDRNASRIDAVRDRPAFPPYAWLILIGAALLGAWLVEGARARKRTD